MKDINDYVNPVNAREETRCLYLLGGGEVVYKATVKLSRASKFYFGGGANEVPFKDPTPSPKIQLQDLWNLLPIKLFDAYQEVTV